MVVFKYINLNTLSNHRYRQADRIRPSRSMKKCNRASSSILIVLNTADAISG
jgi:hypothetical protein